MSCAYPKQAWLVTLPTGRRKVVFKGGENIVSEVKEPIQIPCGQCMLCRISKAREWAVRLEHEAQMHLQSCFLTLTYDKAHVPRTKDGYETLCYRDVTLFLKRLRKKIGSFRYFYCGEYGESGLDHPHYHLVIFDYFPSDSKKFKKSGASWLFLSKEIYDLWYDEHSKESLGFHTVARNVPETMRYVAGYVLKKRMAKQVELLRWYNGREKERVFMSRRPGIGSAWLDRFYSDVYPADRVVTKKGHELRPPRYYDKKFFGEIDNEMEESIKGARRDYLRSHQMDVDRLQCREEIERRKVDEFGKRGKVK